MYEQFSALRPRDFPRRIDGRPLGRVHRRRPLRGGAALLVRLNRYGIIDDKTLAYAFRTFARRWRAEEPRPIEPAELRGRFERPRRFQRLCYRALAERYISPGKAMELLQQPLHRIERAMKGPGFVDAHPDR